MIAQSYQLIGTIYNKTTQEFEEQEFEYPLGDYTGDYTLEDYTGDYAEAEIEATESETSNTQQQTTTPPWIGRKDLGKMEKDRPYLIKKGLPELPAPWESKCPNSLKKVY